MKKREKARLRQRKCREKKKREAIDRQFPAVDQALAIDLPLHAIFPCVPPSNDDCIPPNRKHERNSHIHDDKDNYDTTPPPSSPPSNTSYQLDADTRTTPIPSVSPTPAILGQGQRQETQLPTQRYLFSSVTPFFYSCDSNRYRASSQSKKDDDNGDSGSSIHRVTPTPAIHSYRPAISEHHSTENNHPLFAVDALLSICVTPHFPNDRTNEYEYSGGTTGYHRPPPPQLPPLLHHHRRNSSSSFSPPLDCGGDTPLPHPSKRGRSSFEALNGYRSNQVESKCRRY